jgi:hypothetical protein
MHNHNITGVFTEEYTEKKTEFANKKLFAKTLIHSNVRQQLQKSTKPRLSRKFKHTHIDDTSAQKFNIFTSSQPLRGEGFNLPVHNWKFS